MSVVTPSPSRSVDENMNGVLDFEEFVAILTHKMEGQNRKDERVLAYTLLGQNGSGGGGGNQSGRRGEEGGEGARGGGDDVFDLDVEALERLADMLGGGNDISRKELEAMAREGSALGEEQVDKDEILAMVKAST